MKKLLFVFFTCSLLSGCTQVTHVYSRDWKNSITIINKASENRRYIIYGNKARLQKNNYLELDISKVNSGPFTDNIFVCWPQKKIKGKIIVPNAILIKNSMPSKFIFNNTLPYVVGKDTLDYNHCTGINYYYKDIEPQYSGHIK